MPGHPFQPGNELAVRHGGNSPSMIAERAEQIHGDLLSVAPWLDSPMFLPSVARYLNAAATESLLDEYVQKTAAAKGVDKVASRIWEQLTAARRLAAKLASDLGLDPIGHARILSLKTSADVGQAGLEAVAERGRQAMERRRIRLEAEAAEAALSVGVAALLTKRSCPMTVPFTVAGAFLPLCV